MSKHLNLTIELGNDALAEPADAAPLLTRVAGQLEAGYTFGQIHDANGNQVGTWTVVDR
jgi:hypothetical protein